MPSPAGLVVKNGSNTRCSVSSDIPVPVSETSVTTVSPSRAVRITSRFVGVRAHGVFGVDDQVQDDLLQLLIIARDLGQIDGSRCVSTSHAR